MQLNQVRTLALVATAAVLLLTVAAGARQRGDSNVPGLPAAENAPATPADKVSPAVTAPAPAPAHQHGRAVEKVPAASQNVGGKAMVIVGEVMDPACFLEAGAKSVGPGHLKCAIDCARSGQTLAIYDRDEDRIYFIAGELPGKNPNDPVINFVHKKVDVTGTVYHRSDAWGIVIHNVALHVDGPGKPEKSEKIEKTEKTEAAPGGTKLEAAYGKPGAPATGAPAGK